LGCFNEIPLTYKLHCIKAIPKEDPKRAKKRDRDTEHDRNDFDKGTSKDNTKKGFFCLKVGSTSFDQCLPQLLMVSAKVKGTIKQRKVCKDYCIRGLTCTQRLSMFLHVTDITHIKGQAERQAIAMFAENHPQIKLAPGQSTRSELHQKDPHQRRLQMQYQQITAMPTPKPVRLQKDNPTTSLSNYMFHVTCSMRTSRHANKRRKRNS
jgi:hypothetical protein